VSIALPVNQQMEENGVVSKCKRMGLLANAREWGC